MARAFLCVHRSLEREIMKQLTAKQSAFVLAYLETKNASESYRRAYDCSKMKDQTIGRNAAALLKHPLVATQLQQLEQRAQETAVMDRAGVINLITELATADATELQELQVRNCRHCYGIGHRYQWANEIEYAFRCAEVSDENAKRVQRWEQAGRKGIPPIEDPFPVDVGGYGFIVTRGPNPECPSCLGEGIEVVRMRDTRKLKGGARRLFNGIKKTKDGIEIKFQDRGKYVDMLAKIHKVVPEDVPGALGAVGAAPVQAETIPDDPLAASRLYQDMMKG